MLEIDLSQAVPTAEWNIYGSEYAKNTPKLTSLQIQWDGLTGTLNGTISLEISNRQGTGTDPDEFVTVVPLLKADGSTLALDTASNKSDCFMQLIKAPHGSWRLKVSKGGITAGTLKALMIEPSNG